MSLSQWENRNNCVAPGVMFPETYDELLINGVWLWGSWNSSDFCVEALILNTHSLTNCMSLFLQNEYPSLENKTITNYDIAVSFLLPPFLSFFSSSVPTPFLGLHIWCSETQFRTNISFHETDLRIMEMIISLSLAYVVLILGCNLASLGVVV